MADTSSRPELKTLLMRWCDGDCEAGNQLIAAVYPDLRRLAAYYLRNETPGQTLDATALVHELYLRLFAGETPQLRDRAHFFALVARHLRHITIDHARMRQAEKRGGRQVNVPLSRVDMAVARDEDLVELDRELENLEKLDVRAAQVVELRFFGGLRENEISEALGISVATVKRDWEFARAWLLKRLEEGKNLSQA